VLDEQFPHSLVTHGRDLDEFGKTVADLSAAISNTIKPVRGYDLPVR
jgi:hypothetical protein